MLLIFESEEIVHRPSSEGAGGNATGLSGGQAVQLPRNSRGEGFQCLRLAMAAHGNVGKINGKKAEATLPAM
jgi:hypothetical protein